MPKRTTTRVGAAAMLCLGLAAAAAAQTIIIDDNNANNVDGTFTVLSGTWSTGTAAPGHWADSYRYASAGGAFGEVEWVPNLPDAGSYEISIYYPEGTNRTPDAPFTIHHAGGSATVHVDQTDNGGVWLTLGTHSFAPGTSGRVSLSNDASSGAVIADAVRFALVEPAAPQFRAFWADAFGVGFKSPAEIDSMVARAVAGRYNAIVPEVLAYQDTSSSNNGHGAYWHSSIVPWASVVNAGFDPLEYLCERAHQNGIEVHAWVVTYRVCTSWPPNGNSTIAAHPEWIMVPYADMGDGPAEVDDKYVLDPGSPEVQEYIVSIVRELVTNYEIDGINFDYIRYTSTDAGYPADESYPLSSLARFREITGYVGTPSSGNSSWSDFRRRTIDELIRRCRAEIPSIRTNPRQPLRLSADLFCSGSAPTNFIYSSAYALHQNFKHWQEMAWLDAAMPMNYKDERNSDHATWYRSWIDAVVSWKGDRHAYCGQGNYLNSKANSVIQLDYAYDADADGTVNYSYRATADENDDGTAEADWSWYTYVGSNLFVSPVPPPDMPWRDPAQATEGTLWGRVTDYATGKPLDDATVTVQGSPSVQTDGNGYYVVTLIPATEAGTMYEVEADYPGYDDPAVSDATVLAGDVVSLDLALGTPPLLFDFDENGVVDNTDTLWFVFCLQGPTTTYPAGDFCLAGDADADSDVDTRDHAAFQTAMTE